MGRSPPTTHTRREENNVGSGRSSRPSATSRRSSCTRATTPASRAPSTSRARWHLDRVGAHERPSGARAPGISPGAPIALGRLVNGILLIGHRDAISTWHKPDIFMWLLVLSLTFLPSSRKTRRSARGLRISARPSVARSELRPCRTGHFYLAETRTFLLSVDT